ncbi:hypothetical protein EFP34_14920 [Lacticaseibacillus paracasei]|uniref:hypothetical protein n=1 Tax=Lacticaseibacillus paracasei TaxID=1597 RepID=UPI0021A490E7|nr:hypothetical protein [Lacticaseibacillus paracasei]MCT3351776.1 hypothetical protein [Lacticaseibacillus paracasei]
MPHKQILLFSISSDDFSTLKDAIIELRFKIDQFDIHYDSAGQPFYHDYSGQKVYDGDVIKEFMHLPELENIIQHVERD